MASNTDTITAVENYGKAKTAFGLALEQAAVAREETMRNLGVDILGQQGTVLTPEQAAKKLGPDGAGLGTARLKTGIGEGAIPTIAKEGAATAYAAATDVRSRGITGGGLVGQTKAITGEATSLAEQAAVKEAMKSLYATEQGVLAAQAGSRDALATLRAAQGIKVKNKKKGGG